MFPLADGASVSGLLDCPVRLQLARLSCHGAKPNLFFWALFALTFGLGNLRLPAAHLRT